eukprot:301758-Chlamydomonas_euryale.AAC.1
MFVDNSGADIVLGMLPLARELLRAGSEVVLVANSLPAINDITAPELRALLSAAASLCPVIRAARSAAVKVEAAHGGRVPAHPAATAAAAAAVAASRGPSPQQGFGLARSPEAQADSRVMGDASA